MLVRLTLLLSVVCIGHDMAPLASGYSQMLYHHVATTVDLEISYYDIFSRNNPVPR